MSELYIIDSTDGTKKIGITPGAYNGPGGVVTDTDLRLYGAGQRKWGEGVDENFYRILENFSCPAKKLNDYNQSTSLFNFDPTVDGIVPKDSYDLGSTLGVTNPVPGQVWFNSSINQIMVYNGVKWRFVSGTSTSTLPPQSPNNGDLWYDITISQLKFWNGTAWIIVANTTLLDVYVEKSGDIMTGFLILSGNPTANLHAVPKQFLDSSISDLSSNISLNYYTKPTSDNLFVHLIGAETIAGAKTFSSQIKLTGSGNTDHGSGQIFLNGASSNRIDFNAGGVAPPSFNTRSIGTKICVWPDQNTSTTDYAIGIDNNTLWFSTAGNTSNYKFKWYGGTTEIASLDGTGIFTTDEIIVTGTNIDNLPRGQIRLNRGLNPEYSGTIFRNDGIAFYILTTGIGNTNGSYNTERPLAISGDGTNLSSAANIFMAHPNRTITLSKNPTSNMHAATKQYADGSASFTVNGYQILPGGMIMQWGSGGTVTGYLDQVNFPIPFPNYVATIQITESNVQGWGPIPPTTTFGTTRNNLSSFLVSESSSYDGNPNAYNIGVAYNWFAVGW